VEPRREELWVGGTRLEAQWHGPRRLAAAPGDPALALTIVLLHEGLGSVSTWREWPARIARETACPVLVSRAGYGRSDATPVPRPLDYMEREGRDVLPRVLDAAGVGRAILVGHSDGGSIALVHAATERATSASPSSSPSSARVQGLVLLAPHVVCEDVSVRAIEAAREEYLHGDLRARLARHHGANVDVAFWGWNRAWLDPAFRAFDLTGYLPDVRAPTVVLQGERDPYGTARQVELVAAGCAGPVTVTILPGVGHAPQREAEDATTAAVVELAARVLA
jgi:pimeloyl-ACP methyl ester carboxylesterase